MRSLICASAMLVLLGCAATPESEHEVQDDLGWISQSMLLGDRYPEFAAVYRAAVIAPEFLELITQVQEGAEFLVFIGTWCGDSRREVPRFLRIAKEAGIEESRVRLYNLDRSKTSPDGLTERWAIDRVPTFIILRQGREVGRIVERPRSTLEGDLLSILAIGT
jgi:thiol-disulfide isomerase/thioredoxin